MPNLRMQLSGVQALLNRMNLQSRFLLIIGTSSLLLALVIWAVFNSVTSRVIDRIGVRFAEKQVLYDKARTLQPLIREVALAQHMADSAIIKRWAANERDPKLSAAALAEMEEFRKNFQDRSFFLALAGSGHYYFNDASGQYLGRELRYTLRDTNPGDAWFYATIRSAQDYHINVDPDAKLGVTKVWINVLLRDGDKVLGVIGTGLDLSDFIRNVADINQPGITNLFVDQGWGDPDLPRCAIHRLFQHRQIRGQTQIDRSIAGTSQRPGVGASGCCRGRCGQQDRAYRPGADQRQALSGRRGRLAGGGLVRRDTARPRRAVAAARLS